MHGFNSFRDFERTALVFHVLDYFGRTWEKYVDL